MKDHFDLVIDNFTDQARSCEDIGSPFYAALLPRLAEQVERSSEIGQVFSSWQGDPKHDAVALRFVAALHHQALSQQDPELAALFETLSITKQKPSADRLAAIIARHKSVILQYLRSAPQTNEVGRSAVLLGGFLEVARQFGPAMDVFEIGASAGLNLSFDCYYYRSHDWQWGDVDSTVRFNPEWQGQSPPLGPIEIHNRSACDVSPIDLARGRTRLLSYVWPDQTERLQRSKAAIDMAIQAQHSIDAVDAADWLVSLNQLKVPARPRVIYHSIMWQYLGVSRQQRMTQTLNLMGEKATMRSPLIWMRLEPAEHKPNAELRITVWPDRKDSLLASSGYHGEWVDWHGVG